MAMLEYDHPVSLVPPHVLNVREPAPVTLEATDKSASIKFHWSHMYSQLLWKLTTNDNFK